VNSEVGFVDHNVRPDPVHQLSSADHFTSSFDERHKDIEGPPAERDGLLASKQQPLA
jgi:hypothetical protein